MDGFKTTSVIAKTKATNTNNSLQTRQYLDELEIYGDEKYKRVEIAAMTFGAASQLAQAAGLAFEKGSSDYKAGTITLSEFLDFEKELRQAEVQKSQAYVSWLVAIGEYLFFNGADISQLLGA